MLSFQRKHVLNLEENSVHVLHITNGESAANGIQHTGIPGALLAWVDVLHEGPTPASLSLEQMSQVRARFIAAYYALPFEEIMGDFIRRDAALARFRDLDEVVLWFEHDLYDQLQLMQLLDWFAQQELGKTRLSLMCINRYPGVDHFYGLGQLTPRQLASLFDMRQEVTQAQLQLGRDAWSAHCSPIPLAVERLKETNTSALPFLEHALLRYVEEFPATENGLSRTEQHILEIVVSGIHKPAEMFRALSEKEENPFMGDTTFWVHVAQLCQGFRPLLKRIGSEPFSLPERGENHEAFLAQEVILTKDGAAVLGSYEDWIKLCGGIDRWLGGVHLQGTDAAWRWDRRRNILVQPDGC